MYAVNYDSIIALVKEGREYWNKIKCEINDEVDDDIDDDIFYYVHEVYSDISIFDNDILNFLLSLNKPKEKISCTKIGFINEILGYDFDQSFAKTYGDISHFDISSSIKNDRLCSNEYEKSVPFIIIASIFHINNVCHGHKGTLKLYPYIFLNIMEIVSYEFLKCNEDEVDIKYKKRLDKRLVIIKDYIKQHLDDIIIKRINGFPDIHELKKNESGICACIIEDVEKVTDDNNNKLSEIKSKWNELVDAIENVEVNGGEVYPETLMRHRLLERLFTYVIDEKSLTRWQIDIIAEILGDDRDIVYQDEKTLFSLYSDLFKSIDGDGAQIDICLLVNLDNRMYEPGDDSIWSKKYIEFFKKLSNFFNSEDNNKKKKEILKKHIRELTEYAKKELNPSISEIFFSTTISTPNTEKLSGNKFDEDTDSDPLGDLILQLKSLIGIEKVKNEVNMLDENEQCRNTNNIKINKTNSEDSEDSDYGLCDEYESNDVEDNTPIESNDEEISLSKLMGELNDLIGLDTVKNEVTSLINLLRVNKVRAERGMKQVPTSKHLVFSGNPGTGKTTVARILAKIYKALGVLSKGQLIEVDRSKLVAGYVGQTAIQTQEVIQQALGGILFIDEAYTLSSSKGSNDYGQEAIDTILKAMEDNRDDFVVIVAGYPDLMQEFLDSNPGLRSRFNKYINFEDYTPDELTAIFNVFCEKSGYTIDDEIDGYLHDYFEKKYNNRDRNFANGREVRNFFESAVSNQANRLAIDPDLTDEELITLTIEDVRA